MMNLTITQKKDNPLLERYEIKGRVDFQGATSSKAQVVEQLGKELPAEPGLIVLGGINTIYGRQQAAFSAVVYKTAEARKKFYVVPSHLKKKEQGEKKEEAKPPAKK